MQKSLPIGSASRAAFVIILFLIVKSLRLTPIESLLELFSGVRSRVALPLNVSLP